MDILGNTFLQNAYDAAKLALNDASLSHEDTVMQLDGNSKISGHKWVKLGGRSDDFKAENQRMREKFYNNLVALFGGKDKIDKLPKALRDALKLYDFKLSGNEVKSERPLTARRIIAICEAAKQWKESQVNNDAPAAVPGKLANAPKAVGTASVQNHSGTTRQDEIKQIKEEVAKLSKHRELNTVSVGIASTIKLQMMNGASIEHLRTLRDAFKLSLDLDAQCLSKVKEQAANRPVREQCVIFDQLSDLVTGEGFKKLQGLINKPDLRLEEFQAAVNDLMNQFDFTQEVDQDQIKDLHDNTMVKFMQAHVELNRETYKGEKGGTNPDLIGGEKLVRTKYDNIKEGIAIRDFLVSDKYITSYASAAVDESNFYSSWYKAEQAFQADEKNAGKDFDPKEYIAQYKKEHGVMTQDEDALKAFGEYKKRKLDYDKKLQKNHATGPEFPSTLTPSGQRVAAIIYNKLRMSSHAEINTAQQMYDVIDTVSGIGDLFIKCLERDQENGNTEMFNKFMDALNSPGCLQFRSEPLQEIKSDIELGVDLSVNLASSAQPLSEGVGNKIGELYKANKDQPITYDSFVSEYLKTLGVKREGSSVRIKLDGLLKGGIEGSSGGVEVLNKYSNPPDHTEVTVSEGFLREPAVKKAIYEYYSGFFVDG